MDGLAYKNELGAHTTRYLFAPILRVIENECQRRIFEVGCGNGANAKELMSRGYSVTGVDPSPTGITLANRSTLHVGSAYDALAATYGTFPIVLSLEVIEHLYQPRAFARTIFDLLQPGGLAIISTPYHGYLKNLALALSGRFDSHFNPLWDGGHIKFWSRRTLGALLTEAGFTGIRFQRVGRIPPLAKSMIAIARKPVHAGAGQPKNVSVMVV